MSFVFLCFTDLESILNNCSIEETFIKDSLCQQCSGSRRHKKARRSLSLTHTSIREHRRHKKQQQQCTMMGKSEPWKRAAGQVWCG